MFGFYFTGHHSLLSLSVHVSFRIPLCSLFSDCSADYHLAATLLFHSLPHLKYIAVPAACFSERDVWAGGSKSVTSSHACKNASTRAPLRFCLRRCAGLPVCIVTGIPGGPHAH